MEKTATLNISWPCTLCGADIHIIMGERQRHICRVPYEAPHGPDEPCTCEGCWECKGAVVGCTCDIDWEKLYAV